VNSIEQQKRQWYSIYCYQNIKVGHLRYLWYYIGRTQGRAKIRDHRREGLLGEDLKKIPNSIISCVIWSGECILEEVKDRKKYYIEEYACVSPNGYNLNCGGGISPTEKTKRLLREAALCQWKDPESKRRLLEAQNIGKNRPEVRKKNKERSKIIQNRPEVKKRNKEAAIERWKDPEKRAKYEKTIKIGKNKLGAREKAREVAIKCWQDPKFIAKQIKARHAFPNKLEKFLDNLLQKLLSNQWKYVGSGDFIVEGTRRNPDFVHVNQKKIIELFGSWWHGEERTGVPNEQHEQERINYFATEGYQTLIIWEYELKDVDKLIKKILKFNNEE